MLTLIQLIMQQWKGLMMKSKFKHEEKVVCIDDSDQKVLKLGKVYTVDKTFNAAENRVFIKEWERFSFSESRFESID